MVGRWSRYAVRMRATMGSIPPLSVHMPHDKPMITYPPRAGVPVGRILKGRRLCVPVFLSQETTEERLQLGQVEGLV